MMSLENRRRLCLEKDHAPRSVFTCEDQLDAKWKGLRIHTTRSALGISVPLRVTRPTLPSSGKVSTYSLNINSTPRASSRVARPWRREAE